MSGQSILEQDDYTFIHQGLKPETNRSKRGKEGVAIVLSKEALKAWNATGKTLLNEFGSRILAIRLACKDLRDNDICIFLISAYAPVSAAKDTVWKNFLSNLENCIRRKPKDDILLIGCDCNSSLGICYERRPEH